MNPAETQIALSLAIAMVFIAVTARRMMRPRRFRPKMLWIWPALVLLGAVSLIATRPVPSAGHTAGLIVALVLGGALGWARAKLTRVAFDRETGLLTQSGTPFGIMLLVGLLIVRSAIRLLAIEHPELGIDLGRAADILLFFALGLLTSYAGELYRAVGRARVG